MDDGWGTVRTTDGVVSVTDGAVRIERSPRSFVRGQVADWHRGGRREQVQATFRLVSFLLFPLAVVYQLYRLSVVPGSVATVFALGVLGSHVVPFWWNHVRETAIPLSELEGVTLDTDERELTIARGGGGSSARVGGDGGGGRLPGLVTSWLLADETETTVRLRTADDVRKVRSVLHTKGVDVSEPEAGETETVYRVVTENGAVFCKRCRTQVSPSDGACPACDSVLRVERPAV